MSVTLRVDEWSRRLLTVPTLPPPISALLRNTAGRGGAGPLGTRELVRELEALPASMRHTLVRFAQAMVERPSVRSVDRAVGCLGAEQVRDVVLALTLRPGAGAVRWRPAVRVRWRRAVETAMWARLVAAARCRSPSQAFRCGLLHDVGRLALLHTTTAPDGSIAAEEARRVGAELVREWGLPPEVAVTIGHHHRYLRAPAWREVVATVALARRLVRRERAPVPDHAELAPVASFLGLDRAALGAIEALRPLAARAVAVLG